MCNHIYSSDSSKKCPFPNIYKNLSKAQELKVFPKKYSNFNFNLLCDDKSICLYHSKKIDFKKENRMVDQFRLLPSVIHWAQKNKLLSIDRLDFEEFIFVGQEENFEDELMQVDNNEIINLSEITFPEYTSFNNSIFYDDVWLSYCTFHKKTTFDNVKFYRGSDFSDTTFSAYTSFNKCYFGESSGFRATIFNSSAYFENCTFHKSVGFNLTSFKSYVSFNNSRFEKVYLTKTTFAKDINNSAADFKNATFNDTLRIEKVEFEGEVNFSSAKFNLAEWIDIEFSNNQILYLDSIEVTNKLIVKSLDGAKKTFNHIVSLDISINNIKGEILFENTNVYFIKQSEILKELSLPTVKKIIIGAGCDKYRLKKEFNIPVTEEWYSLIKEIAATFVAFFDWNNPFNLSINVECEYFSDYVVVRYFADVNLEQNAFEKILAERTPEFLSFLKDPQSYMKEYLQRTSDSKRSESLINDIDIYRQVNSLNSGIASRFIFDSANWQAKEIQQLLKTIMESPTSNIAIEFHNHIINQRDFFSFGTKKIVSGRNI